MDFIMDAAWQGLLHRRPRGIRRIVMETSPGLDFCVWILHRSGLQSPPFAQDSRTPPHLDIAGLTAPAWNNWFTTVVQRQAQALGLVHQDADVAANGAVIRAAYDPVMFWKGDATITPALASLWESYRSKQYERQPVVRNIPLLTPRQQRALWRQLRRMRLPMEGRPIPETLYLFMVTYPAPVVCAIPPDVVVVSRPAGDAGEFIINAIVQAMERSVTRPTANRTCSGGLAE